MARLAAVAVVRVDQLHAGAGKLGPPARIVLGLISLLTGTAPRRVLVRGQRHPALLLLRGQRVQGPRQAREVLLHGVLGPNSLGHVRGTMDPGRTALISSIGTMS